MSGNNTYDWVPFYKELAGKLLPYKNNRQELVKNVKRIYEMSETKMPTMEKDGNLVDIDPFTVFGIFNKTAMPDEKRTKIVRAIAEIFSIATPVPISFNGVPALNPQNATYYYFLPGRGDADIDDLWELFDAALKYAGDKTPDNKAAVSKYFDRVINKKGNANSKLTMGLFWIAPDVFLNLDSRNQWYIYKSRKLPTKIVQTLPKVVGKISAEKYFEITGTVRKYLQSDSSKLKSFLDLSDEAWRYSEEVNQGARYWLYAPGENAAYWDEHYQAGIMAIGWDAIGDLSKFANKEAMRAELQKRYKKDTSNKNAADATWKFFKEMKPGDVIFVKRGRSKIIGRGEVVSGYEYDASRQHYRNVRKVNWTHKGEWKYPGGGVLKTLTDLTHSDELIAKLKALFDPESALKEAREEFLNEVYFSGEDYDKLVAILEIKKNVILQGAPGVGKTFAAKRLAYSIMGEKDDSRIEFVQFHQNYSYEDFVMGYKPTDDEKKRSGFELKNGIFYTFCKKAEKDPNKKYFFIIDEINRGNMSKIFGELLMLIENDKRGDEYRVKLPYRDEYFTIPENLYIIGMMNTADRSLAMIDYALRRRFAFFTMEPAFENGEFINYLNGFENKKFNDLIEKIKELNKTIGEDKSLGEGFKIGHSYFCGWGKVKNPLTSEKLYAIVKYEIIPMLQEYWYENAANVNKWSEELLKVVQ